MTSLRPPSEDSEGGPPAAPSPCTRHTFHVSPCFAAGWAGDGQQQQNADDLTDFLNAYDGDRSSVELLQSLLQAPPVIRRDELSDVHTLRKVSFWDDVTGEAAEGQGQGQGHPSGAQKLKGLPPDLEMSW